MTNADIVCIINDALSEANEIKASIENGKDPVSYKSTSDELNAKYQLIMDAAEHEISEEYKTKGSFTGTRICEINKGMDDYAMTLQDVMDLIDKLS